MSLLVLYALILAFPGPRDFFSLAVPNAGVVVSSLGGAVLAVVGLVLTDDRFVPHVGDERAARRRQIR